jgi:hypothetical protein
MATLIEVSTRRDFGVKADAKTAFALLAHVPASASHYPKVKALVDLGDGAYRWEMEPIGIGGFSHQVVYAARYERDERQGTVTWSPVKSEGNSEISGSLRVTPQDSGTRVVLEVRGRLAVPVPLLLRPVAGPFVEREFNQQIETYVANLTRALGGAAS